MPLLKSTYHYHNRVSAWRVWCRFSRHRCVICDRDGNPITQSWRSCDVVPSVIPPETTLGGACRLRHVLGRHQRPLVADSWSSCLTRQAGHHVVTLCYWRNRRRLNPTLGPVRGGTPEVVSSVRYTVHSPVVLAGWAVTQDTDCRTGKLCSSRFHGT